MSAPLAPMLLSSARELPKGEDWAFEPKWDGFRCLAHLGEATRLVSRRGKDLLPLLPELSALHRSAPLPVMLDGELVAVHSGKPSFDALRRRVFGSSRPPEATVILVVFDLLVLGERSETAPVLPAPPTVAGGPRPGRPPDPLGCRR